jgi:hypothetical protein
MCDIWNIGIGKTTWQEMDKKYLWFWYISSLTVLLVLAALQF